MPDSAQPVESAKPTTKPTEIKCPDCGNMDVAQMRYVEDICNWREPIEFDTAGHTLKIDAFYRSGAGYDHGTNPRLECRADVGPDGDYKTCLTEFPIPEGVQLDFV